MPEVTLELIFLVAKNNNCGTQASVHKCCMMEWKVKIVVSYTLAGKPGEKSHMATQRTSITSRHVREGVMLWLFGYHTCVLGWNTWEVPPFGAHVWWQFQGLPLNDWNGKFGIHQVQLSSTTGLPLWAAFHAKPLGSFQGMAAGLEVAVSTLCALDDKWFLSTPKAPFSQKGMLLSFLAN